MTTQRRWRIGAKKASLTAVAGLALAALLGGCAAPSPASTSAAPAVSESDIDKALDQETTITIWTWATTLTGIIEAFEKEHPKITVDVVNVGTGAGHYTKLENALKAGSGAPDLATIEYSVLPQFALSGTLVDLNRFGYGDLADEFTPSVWNSTTINDGLYELPHNAGPMALFYNKTVFDQFGIEVPTTWAEYADAAKKIHEADPTVYLAADNGDAGFTTSMLWAAGSKPFQTTGTTDVTIDLADKGAQKFTDFYSPLIEDGLLAPTAGFSNEWYQGLANGKIASIATGAWMAGSLKSGVPTGAGQWRVAPLPTYEKGDKASAMNGGGGYAMLNQGSEQNQLVAAAFLKYMEAGPGVQLSIDAGQFPATVADLESDAFLTKPNDYFGGQEINQVFAESAANVVPDWQYLPYQSYANTVFGDTAGQAYIGKTTLADGLTAWGDQLVTFGNQQGFTVK